jgi:thiamine pyrophosphokinase
VTTDGLLFPLADVRLDAGSSLGVSNVLVGQVASVSLRSGVLAVVRSDPQRS